MPQHSLENFEKAYQQLNDEQRDGPVFVVAGPGTGKTQVLTLRIANILQKTDTAASSILAITFTEAGVRAMKDRLLSLVGEEARNIAVHTYHSFCSYVRTEHPEYFSYYLGKELVEEEDQLSLIRSILNRQYEHLYPFGDPDFYVNHIRSAISSLKREAISAEAFQTQVKEKIGEIEDDPVNTHQKGRWEGKMKGEPAKELKKCRRSLELADV